jgi:hypothetical protein
MDGKSSDLSNKLLDHALGGGNYTRPATVYLALFDAAAAELSGNGYARKAVTNDATNFPAAASRLKSNGIIQEFSQASGAWNDVYRVKVMDAASAGNAMFQGFLGTDQGAVFTAIAAGDVLTVPGTSLVVNDRVVILAIDGSALPTGLADETLYYVKTVTGNEVVLSLTQGGAAVDVTAAGAGIIKKVTPRTGIATGHTVRFGVGEIQVRES